MRPAASSCRHICLILLLLSAALAHADVGDALQLSLSSTTDLFRNLRGGADQGTALSHLGELSLLLDAESAWGGRGGTLFVLAARANGQAPAELAGTVHAVSNLAADDDWYLLEAWYEQRLLQGRSAVLAGVYAVDAEFDARVAAEVFTNGAFGTGLDLSESGAAGPGIFPQTGLGVRLRHAVSTHVTLRAAAVDGRPTAGRLDERLELRRNEGALLIAELDYQPAASRPVRYAVGAWAYSREQEQLEQAGGRAAARGAYAFWEGELFRDASMQQRYLSGFLRVGLAEEQTSPVRLHYSAGLSLHAPLPGRAEDTAGIAVSHARLSDAARLCSTPQAETVWELTYSAQINPWLRIQPVLQYALDPSDAQGQDAFLAGLRLGLSF